MLEKNSALIVRLSGAIADRNLHVSTILGSRGNCCEKTELMASPKPADDVPTTGTVAVGMKDVHEVAISHQQAAFPSPGNRSAEFRLIAREPNASILRAKGGGRQQRVCVWL